MSAFVVPTPSACVNIVVNGQAHELASGTTIAQLLALLKLPARGVAVERNLEIVPRPQHAQQRLEEGDRLEIVSLVGGG
jgi:sulfur carrier protein